MSTLDLIDRLALDARPVRPGNAARDLGAAALLGAAATLGLVVAGFGVQPGLGAGATASALAMKLAYVGALGVVAGALALALARPGAKPPTWRWLLLPVGALAAFAAATLAGAAASGGSEVLFGASWTRCPWRIAVLSLPIAATLTIAMRAAAPTDLRRAGAAVGLAAGAIAAALYALACTETSPAFVLVWYSLGIALSTGLGAALGPRVLRW